MPVRGRGAFPKPSAVYREEGGGSGGGVIVEYRALKKLQNSAEALNILRRIGASVRPIMIKHGWKLPLLVEMYPKQDNLLGLNVNRGKKIALRLRRPYNDLEFIDEESIIETMLHELAHNLRGPHDEIFFQHLETLTQEFYDLRANKSLPGLGFMSAGQKLGGSGGRGGMETRRDISRIIGSGSNRVGGSSVANLPPREAAAAAAHRRKVIAMGCPSNSLTSTKEANEEQERQELLHGVEVITIGDDDDKEDDDNDDDFEIVENEQMDSSDDEIVVTAVKKLKREERSTAKWEESSTATYSRSWNCQACTLLNDRYAETCVACEAVRPGVAFWVCRSCQHHMIGTYSEFWCCTECKTVKIA
ncbi:hypothetical protein L7F22_003104 [Adiantum nelumboides]|nr:hypothetical protein [Adiantum nelumboides]